MNPIKLISIALFAGGGVIGGVYGLNTVLSVETKVINKPASIEQTKTFLTSGEWKEEEYDHIPESVFAGESITFTEADYEKMSKHWSKTIEKMPLAFFQKFQSKSQEEDFHYLELFDLKTMPSGHKGSFYLPMIKKIQLPEDGSVSYTPPIWKRIEIKTGPENSEDKIQFKYNNKDGKKLAANTAINAELIKTCENWLEQDNCSTITEDEKTIVLTTYETYVAVVSRLKTLEVNQEASNLTTHCAKLDPDE